MKKCKVCGETELDGHVVFENEVYVCLSCGNDIQTEFEDVE